MFVTKSNLVEKTKAHVVIGLLFGFLLLFFLLFLSSRGSGSTSGSSSSGGSRADSRSNVGDEVLDVAAFQALGKEAGPEGLNIDAGGLQDGGDFLGLKRKISTRYLLTIFFSDIITNSFDALLFHEFFLDFVEKIVFEF